MKSPLNTQLNYPWPKHANGISWSGHTIAGLAPFTELSAELSFEQLLFDTFESLSFSQFAELHLWAKTNNLQPDWLKISENYNLRWSEILQTTIEAYLQTPNNFKTWCFNKKIGARDLAPLLILNNKTHTILNLFLELNLSKSEGSKILDLLCDLISMDIKNVFPETNDSKKWFKKLYKLRHPQSTATDQNFSDKITSWPWPKDFSTEWKRQGDKSFMSVEFKIENQQEFTKKSDQLNYIKNWVEKNNPLWDQQQDNLS